MTISEFAEKTDISIDTLRYYERIGILPPVPRGKNGIRVYDSSYIEWIHLVKRLKANGMSLDRMLEYIELTKQGRSSCSARRQLLMESRGDLLEKIMELKVSLKNIDDTLNYYKDEVVSPKEWLI